MQDLNTPIKVKCKDCLRDIYPELEGCLTINRWRKGKRKIDYVCDVCVSSGIDSELQINADR